MPCYIMTNHMQLEPDTTIPTLAIWLINLVTFVVRPPRMPNTQPLNYYFVLHFHIL